MAYNRRVKVKRGETGFVITATLYDDNKDVLDLSEGGTWAVVIAVTAPDSTENVLEGDTMTVLNQVTYPGQCTYAMTEDDALLAAGEYDLEIIATEPGGRVHKFPKSEGDVFGTLVMWQSKAAE